MRSEILRELQAEYEQRRALNLQEENRRREEAMTACPELSALLDERENMIFAGVRGILTGQSPAADLPERMEIVNRRVAALLKSHGFAPDYLDPVYRCRACKDTGYVGEPVKEMCECLRGAFYARLYKRIGLADGDEQSFEHFDLTIFPDTPLPGKGFSQRDVMAMFRNRCQQWADQWPESSCKDVLLMGQSGLGKTYLMHAMAKRLLQRGKNVLLISAYRFLSTARNAYFSGKTEELDTLADADVLMLDDLGSEPLMENITIVQLFNLINERQVRNRATVITTNLMAEEFRQRYTERIASRLMNDQCMVLHFLGDDVRRRNR